MSTGLTPAALWRQLRSIDAGLLDQLAFLSRLRSRQSPKGAAYCTPGRKYLAGAVGVSVATVTRHTRRLVELGVLVKRQRRPVDGKWQTNIYSLVGRGAWLVARSMHAMRWAPNRRASKRDIAPSEGKAELPDGGKAALRAAILTLSQRLRGG
jgi:DNA-binding MarR family transcriptional regulator